jgi:hypothetical protein
MASAISGNLNSYESISTTTLGSSQTTVTFSSIPSTYKHLQIRCLIKTSRTSNVLSSTPIIFNSDSGNNYSCRDLTGNGSSVSASVTANGISIDTGRVAGNTGATNVFGVQIVDILEYANTSIYKSVKISNGFDNNGAGVVAVASGSWRSTSAISSITFNTPFDAAAGYLQYSSFALYGIKG